MRLEKLQKYLEERKTVFQYTENDGLGSVDFEDRGLSYHVWEFYDDIAETYGAESNVMNAGKQEEYFENYEEIVIDIITNWK